LDADHPAKGVLFARRSTLSDNRSRAFSLENAAIADLRWSPDGKSLAVLVTTAQAGLRRTAFQPSLDWDGSSRSTPRQSVAILDSSNGAVVDEVPTAYDLVGLDADFSWSPDGRKIAFSAQLSGADRSSPAGPNIYVWDLVTRAIKVLSDRPGPNLDPRWSPDGRRIAYLTSERRDLLKGGLQLVVQSSSGHEQVIVSKPDETTGSPYLPTWIDAEHLALLQTWGTAARRHPVGGLGSIGEMLIEHNHGFGQGRGSNSECSFNQAHLPHDTWLQAPCLGLSFA